ncbi:PREDICTED: peroxisomal leader peptide-processing protease-like [Amphimedon queenslandica]|uniref:Peroxisomal leader peptide-processing protease n=1 Tax=Amphimedon queenslandica TaxID=400682 RepID=A0AAN0JGD9_AMPQE|nr:PREDICTED: peroxisomal leader peptide-processing protease-like [Amphimedon queenslandica]|eukprot:XP_019855852.1 PREDICTED: peroxisomal leader peptide-processing protease-like [Amphimedon queenslandica]
MKNLKTTNTVYSICTPFGGDYFVSYCLNTLSHGHIRKRIDSNLLLVDMQLVYGCEGGLVIALDENELKFLGMIVVASVNTGDVALVVSSEIIMDLVRIEVIHIPTKIKSNANKIVPSEGQYIVFIKCGATSGSGIILSPSIVLTWSHVVKESCHYPVEVKLRECSFTATVLFSASLLDLAILLLHPSLPANTKHLFQLSLPEGIELLGSQVHAIGYHHKSVKVTSGILSKLVCDPASSIPILIKSNASLHNGMSGGLLLHTESSIPIGILQFNMKDHASNVAFVSANFSLPLSLILEPIKQLLYDKNFKSLKKLNQKINHGKNLLSKL